MMMAKLAIAGIQPEPSRRQAPPASIEPLRGTEEAFARLLDGGLPPEKETEEAASDVPAGDSTNREHAVDPIPVQRTDLPALLLWQTHGHSLQRVAAEPHAAMKTARAVATHHAEKNQPAGGLLASGAVLPTSLGTVMADREPEDTVPVVALRMEEGSPEPKPETGAADSNAAIRKAADGGKKSDPHGQAAQDTVRPPAVPSPSDPSVQLTPARQIVEALKAPMAELASRTPTPGIPLPARQLQIVLQPDHLGEVNVTLRLEGGRLRVTITAERLDTATLLQQDKQVLDGILQGAASETTIVSIAVRETDTGTASSGTQSDARGGPSSNTGTMGQRGEGRSFPDKASGTKLRRLEESFHEESHAPDPARRGIVVV